MRGSSIPSAILQAMLLPLPWRIRRPLLNLLFGFKIDRGARVGLSLLLADRVAMGEGAYIGDLNVIKKMAELNLACHAKIGRLNWINGYRSENSPFFKDAPDRISALDIEEHGAVTGWHYLDCTNRVRIGAFSILAGMRSQILTHSIDVKVSHQMTAPVAVGRYCFVGTGAILLQGAVLADYCVLAAGSVLRSAHREEYCVLSGVPAEKVREADKNWAYFHRAVGRVI